MEPQGVERLVDNAHPRIDGYRIIRVIGHGGMSTVYLAEQTSLQRKVALKVMLAEALADEVSRARFENEARIIARLEHPNIVGIHEVGRTADGRPFYSMPYLSRGHLAQRRMAGDQPKAATILRALLQALDYAHVRGVVHRDVKAENVLFDDADRPMLADFGIALRRGSNPRLTHSGLAVGSTAYMPPEQARGQDVDRRADLYSLGVLSWEMLMGRLPYGAPDALSMALKHVQEPIPRLPAILKHWQGFIDTAMAKKPEQRFASAQEMLGALDALAQRAGKAFVPVAVPAHDADVRTSSPSRWRTWAIGAAGLASLCAALAYFVLAQDDVIHVPPQTSRSTVVRSDAPVLPAQGKDIASDGVAPYIANAEHQLRERKLLAPPNGNAWDSLDAAWRMDATHPDTQRVTALLFDALGEAATSAMRAGDAEAARLAFRRARELDARRGGTGIAIDQLRKRLDNALDTRLIALLAVPDAPAASTLLASSNWLGLDAKRQRALQSRIASVRGGNATAAASTQVDAPLPQAAIQIVTVTRADYARFVAATGRAPADCGKGVFGRKRSWRTVGSNARPVTCVSAIDAQVYAAWLGAQDGHHYRLPSAGELRAQPVQVSGWLTLCADTACNRRMASGKQEPLEAAQGYPDVGIHLARRS
ncbi:MAG: bifunctional serine/threonine-protein kinase/formylglycine-generating enzyme family protein [Thermomonas sp.]|uniref:bifunctional serine/threonine-protein kinase/formylglycine-generating enzyme family protein n=1 Tax=Thermomonas sp. TaxID=1971895 RepID=UPI0039E5BD2B